MIGKLDCLAHEGRFSGVVRLDQHGDTVFERAYGLAHRAHGVPNTVQTRFGLASGTKVFTALTVLSLAEEGTLRLDSAARELLGDDLPLIDGRVTIEHLLAHRSGIGDYLDEDEHHGPNDELMSLPVQRLTTTQQYLPMLDGKPMKFAPGTDFSYCNSGYVVLALLAERCSGLPFGQLVQERVCVPGGLTRTAFLRSDQLPGDAATGYLSPPLEDRSNVFHLPVCGSGDGGLYSTVQDVHTLWNALSSGSLLPERWVAQMWRPRSSLPSGTGYGLGLWLLPDQNSVSTRRDARLQGLDAGSSFDSVHLLRRAITFSVISNTADGVWPLARLLRGQL